MDWRLRRVAIVSLICGTLACGACDLQNPDRLVRPPVIKSYSPRAPSIVAALGDTVFFSIGAIDPDDGTLRYSFALGDSVTAEKPQWAYVLEDTGVVEVKGRVSNGTSESAIRWRLRRVTPLNLPPVIVSVDPPEPEVTIVLGSSIEFTISASDPEKKPLSYVYTIGDSIVSVARRYTYRAAFVGLLGIRAVVSDGESFASHSWTLRIAAEPDSVAPAKVVIVSAGPGSDTGEVDIEWIAVGDDSMSGLPSHYVLRTSTTPITDEHLWESSSERPGEPPPASPGDIMRMTVRNLPPARTVYMAVRAVDDFGISSPLSDEASARSCGMKVFGTVRDAVTADPIEGVSVKVASAVDTTGTDGSFVLRELPEGFTSITVKDDRLPVEVGQYFDVVISPYVIRDEDVLDIWMLPNAVLETDDENYPDFLFFYQGMTALQGAPRSLLSRWDVPCRVYVPPLVNNNVDYQATVKEMFREWESTVGVSIFEFVESVPDTGVFVAFIESGGTIDHYEVTRRDERGLTIQGRLAIRTIYTEAQLEILKMVIRHETGHALGLGHSTDEIHLMIGGRTPAVTHPSSDEVMLVRAMYHLPRGWPSDWFWRE